MTAPPEPPAPKKRDETFDVMKGFGISEVILHHALNPDALAKFTTEGSKTWWFFTGVNRMFHWGVPVFLMASVILLTMSAKGKQMDWGHFYKRRALRQIAPYAIWFLFYLGFRLTMLKSPYDLNPIASGWPFGPPTLPTLAADPMELAKLFLSGKMYFHLYFMILLLQVALLFPVFYAIIRRVSWPLWAVLLASFALEYGVYLLQRQVKFPYPATTFLWYIPAISVGLWLGMRWDRWNDAWRGYWPLFVFLWAGCGAVYGWQAYLIAAKQPGVEAMVYAMSAHIYAVSTGLVLLRLAQWLQARLPSVHRLLGAVGDLSLPLFLLHPAVMFLLSGPRVTDVLRKLPMPLVWFYLAIYFFTWLVSYALVKARLGSLLFGRPYATRGN